MNSKTISLDELRRLCGQRDGPPTCSTAGTGREFLAASPRSTCATTAEKKIGPGSFAAITCSIRWPASACLVAATAHSGGGFDSEGAIIDIEANQRGRAEERRALQLARQMKRRSVPRRLLP